jgi:uncharacterized protein (DUF924 family)
MGVCRCKAVCYTKIIFHEKRLLMFKQDRIDNILEFWFGRVEQTIIPSDNRARIWFSEEVELDDQIRDEYLDDLNAAINGDYDQWRTTPRGQLALILLLDQFSRHIYRNKTESLAQDPLAVSICLKGLETGADHQLSLIERVFYYFPLLHSEQETLQKKSLESYQVLTDMALAETRVIFDSFVKFANHHYSVIQRFGRFPQRNIMLSRSTTSLEQVYINEVEEG